MSCNCDKIPISKNILDAFIMVNEKHLIDLALLETAKEIKEYKELAIYRALVVLKVAIELLADKR